MGVVSELFLAERALVTKYASSHDVLLFLFAGVNTQHNMNHKIFNSAPEVNPSVFTREPTE